MIAQTQFEQVPGKLITRTGLFTGAAPVVVPAHVHQWENRPLQSDDRVTRYQCATCQRWGRRVWPLRGRHVPPIRAYPSALTEPKAKWGGEPWPQNVTEESHTVWAHQNEMDDAYREVLELENEGWRGDE